MKAPGPVSCLLSPSRGEQTPCSSEVGSPAARAQRVSRERPNVGHNERYACLAVRIRKRGWRRLRERGWRRLLLGARRGHLGVRPHWGEGVHGRVLRARWLRERHVADVESGGLRQHHQHHVHGIHRREQHPEPNDREWLRLLLHGGEPV